jgi:hypothetical protein
VKSGTKSGRSRNNLERAGTTLEQLWNNLKWRANDSAVQVEFISVWVKQLLAHCLSASAGGSWSEPEPLTFFLV